MGGHSHWSNIKRKKGAIDAVRGKQFTKVAKEIIIAARLGGSSLTGNSRLRLAVNDARALNMPKDRIERAIKKGAGEIEGEVLEELLYEGYGPGGVAVMAEVVTDNRNRTTPEIRFMFEKYGGNMGAANSVGWMFKRRGIVRIPAEGQNEDALMEKVLEAGGEDLRKDGDLFEVETSIEALPSVVEAFETAKIPVQGSELAYLPTTTTQVEGGKAGTLMKLLSALEEHDDVQKVWANYDIDEKVLEALEV